MRIDIWLDVACLCKTRSEAKRACEGGKVDLNGQTTRPHRDVTAGDVVEISRSHGVRQRVIVRGLADQHVPKALARALYEDVTPEPAPEVKAMLEMARLAGPRPARGAGTHAKAHLDKYEKRRLRREKQGDGIL